MSITGPYANPNVTGATTGAYAGNQPATDPWAEVPEVGTIAYHRYIGDAEAERDLLSQLLRGMARRATELRRRP